MADAMTRGQATVECTESAAEAALRIAKSQATHITVLANGTACGVLSWANILAKILARLVAQGTDPNTPVGEIVSNTDNLHLPSPGTRIVEPLPGREVTRPNVPITTPAEDSPVDWDAARAAIEIVCGKWVLSVVAELTEGPKRHNQLSRAVRLDHKRLGGILRHLLEAQIVAKELDMRAQQVPLVRYHLTRKGKDLLPVLAAIGSWHNLA